MIRKLRQASVETYRIFKPSSSDWEKGMFLQASVEVAAVPAEVKAFVRVLYLGVIALMKDGKVGSEIRDQAKGWAAPAKQYLKSVGMEGDLVGELYKALSNKASTDNLANLSKEFRKIMRAKILQDKDLNPTVINIMKAASAYFINNSDRVVKTLVKYAPALHEDSINTELVKEAGSQSTVQRALEKIVKTVTTRQGTSLTADEQERLKKKNKEVLKEYRRLKTAYNDVWKTQLRNYIFKKKAKLIDYKEATDMLKGLNLTFPLLEGFEGQIDANGSLYTKFGVQIKGNPSSEIYRVEMNKDYTEADDQNVMKAIKKVPGGIGKRTAHVFTIKYRKSAGKKIFEKADELRPILPTLRKKWLVHLKKGDKDPRTVASTILELIYQFSARVGSGTGENFGITTVLVGHTKFESNSCLFKYKGKDGVITPYLLQPTTLEGKATLANLRKFAEGKEKTDRLFTYEWNGKQIPMTSNLVNKWFKKLGSPATVHKMRHIKGTDIFDAILKKNEKKIFGTTPPLTQGLADKMLKQIAEAVGKALGHVRGVGKQQKVTGATALASYIDPKSIVSFYTRLNLRVPEAYTDQVDREA
jgi:hypothetical protein